MGFGDRLQSILGSDGGSEADEETIEYECPTCGARFDHPAGTDICPTCYEAGVKQVSGDG